VGQLGFVAALSGFRSVVADFLFIQAYVAWERAEWSRMLLLFRQITTLQPRSILFWEMAAWHMAWNAGTAALNDPDQPRLALRLRAQREYFDLGRDFLARGIRNNPNARSSTRRWRGSTGTNTKTTPALPSTSIRPQRKRARQGMRSVFARTNSRRSTAASAKPTLVSSSSTIPASTERLPTLIKRLKFLEEKLDIPLAERIPDSAP
jgi:hypothetical protein